MPLLPCCAFPPSSLSLRGCPSAAAQGKRKAGGETRSALLALGRELEQSGAAGHVELRGERRRVLLEEQRVLAT